MEEIADRIAKDIIKFNENVKVLDEHGLGPKEIEIVRLAKNYCDDAGAWLKKKDFYTAFASISYAHGLLDTLLRLNSKE
ncbi:MAG: DUF357 domain-containing protein [Candidatus Micrarchaeota archaeon]|nr:DUF357 domain-containing protein [Candidatus Micrarchaeota archaeon]